MIRYEQIHHVSLTVADVEKAKQFYENVLELELEERPPFDFNGEWYKIGRQQLHLIEDTEKTIDTEINTRAPHFAFRVKDYEETKLHLEHHNVPFTAKPDSIAGFAQLYCLDPSGNVIELNTPQGQLKAGKTHE
ncbi:VOC family protein [Alteribacillus sp. HJP-4]|uniref:VOC family protein n=1 Tax=Alteribacillus sp. HJP-4 TaxID=2775394 RepID=UPI0035CD32C3